MHVMFDMSDITEINNLIGDTPKGNQSEKPKLGNQIIPNTKGKQKKICFDSIEKEAKKNFRKTQAIFNQLVKIGQDNTNIKTEGRDAIYSQYGIDPQAEKIAFCGGSQIIQIKIRTIREKIAKNLVEKVEKVKKIQDCVKSGLVPQTPTSPKRSNTEKLPSNSKELKFSIFREYEISNINMITKQKKNLLIPIDKHDGIEHIYVSPQCQNYLLLSFKNGYVQIRKTNDLQKVLFEEKLGEKGAPVTRFVFFSDEFACLLTYQKFDKNNGLACIYKLKENQNDTFSFIEKTNKCNLPDINTQELQTKINMLRVDIKEDERPALIRVTSWVNGRIYICIRTGFGALEIVEVSRIVHREEQTPIKSDQFKIHDQTTHRVQKMFYHQQPKEDSLIFVYEDSIKRTNMKGDVIQDIKDFKWNIQVEEVIYQVTRHIVIANKVDLALYRMDKLGTRVKTLSDDAIFCRNIQKMKSTPDGRILVIVAEGMLTFWDSASCIQVMKMNVKQCEIIKMTQNLVFYQQENKQHGIINFLQNKLTNAFQTDSTLQIRPLISSTQANREVGFKHMYLCTKNRLYFIGSKRFNNGKLSVIDLVAGESVFRKSDEFDQFLRIYEGEVYKLQYKDFTKEGQSGLTDQNESKMKRRLTQNFIQKLNQLQLDIINIDDDSDQKTIDLYGFKNIRFCKTTQIVHFDSKTAMIVAWEKDDRLVKMVSIDKQEREEVKETQQEKDSKANQREINFDAFPEHLKDLRKEEKDLECQKLVISLEMDKICILLSNQTTQTKFVVVFDANKKETQEVYQVDFNVISPNFKNIIVEGHRNIYLVKLIETVEDAKGKQHKIIKTRLDYKASDQKHEYYFTADSQFCGFKCGKNFSIFRISDGTRMTKNEDRQIQLAIDVQGGLSILRGFIDTSSQRFFPWSLKSLAHVCQEDLTIFFEDNVEEIAKKNVFSRLKKHFKAQSNNFSETGSNKIKNSKKEKPVKDKKIQILGGPMPAFYPYMLSEFKQMKKNEMRSDLLMMLNRYTVSPEYQNLLHFLTQQDHHESVQNLQNGHFRYFQISHSPLGVSSSLCGNTLYQMIKRDDLGIASRLKIQELQKIMEFQPEVSYNFFKSLIIEDNQTFNDRTRKLKHEPRSYAQLTDLKNELKIGKEANTQLENELFYTHKSGTRNNPEEKPFVFKTLLFKLNLTAGTSDSWDFHSALEVMGDKNEQDITFTSDCIQVILDYKYEKTFYARVFFFSIYIAYMITMMYFEDAYVVLIWLLIQLLQKMVYIWQGQKNLYDRLFDTFQLIDFARFGFMIAYQVLYRQNIQNVELLKETHCECIGDGEFRPFECVEGDIVGDCSDYCIDYSWQDEVHAYVVFFSFLTLVGYYRFVEKLRKDVEIIVQSFLGMSYFLIVLFTTWACFVIVVQFSLYKTKDERDLVITIMAQYKMLLGDFQVSDDADSGENFQTDNVASNHWVIFFMIITIIQTVVMLNLLVAIVTEAYEKITENLKTREPILKNTIILEMETYMSLSPCKKDKGAKHLVFAEYDEVQDATIWQKNCNQQNLVDQKLKDLENKITRQMDHNSNQMAESFEKELAKLADSITQ